MYSTVLGGRQYSNNLPQGRMEIPCRLHFVGNVKELKKVDSFFKALPSVPSGQLRSTNNDKSVINHNHPTTCQDQLVRNSDQDTAINDDGQPMTNSEQPMVNSELPVMSNEHPMTNSE